MQSSFRPYITIRQTLNDMMCDHVNELHKKFNPTMEILAKRRKVDYELERLLCMYRHDAKMYYKALDELEIKYGVTINPDNPQFWFSESEELYLEHDKKYKDMVKTGLIMGVLGLILGYGMLVVLGSAGFFS